MELKYKDIIGKTILVGFSYYTKDGQLVKKMQAYGPVLDANENNIRIKQLNKVNINANNEEFINLPPDLSALTPAQKGDYILKSTNETVTDPDYTCAWNITLKE